MTADTASVWARATFTCATSSRQPSTSPARNNLDTPTCRRFMEPFPKLCQDFGRLGDRRARSPAARGAPRPSAPRFLNLQQSRRRGSREHRRRRNPRPDERLVTIGRRRPTHVPLHVREAGTAGTCPRVATAGADRQVPHTDRAHLDKGLRVTPDLEKLLAPHVSAGKRELDAGIDIPIGRDVAGGVAGTTGEPVQDRLIRSGRWGTEGRDVPDHALIVEDLPQRAGGILSVRIDVSPSIFGVIVGSI